MEEGCLRALEVEIPRGLTTVARGLAPRLSGPQACLADADPVVGAGDRTRERDLRSARSLGGAVEEREPQRAGGCRAGRLVDRVADPGPERLRRVAGLEVEALVVPRLGRHLREAGLGRVRRRHAGGA